jgi:hypothetical protein
VSVICLLVDELWAATLFDLGGLKYELESLSDIQAHLLIPNNLSPKF